MGLFSSSKSKVEYPAWGDEEGEETASLGQFIMVSGDD